MIGAMSKRGQEATLNDGSPTAKARLVNLVMRSQYKEETSSSSLGSRVNPWNDDERNIFGQAPGNWEQGNSKSEVVSRQEKILQTTRKQRQKDQTQRRVKKILQAPGNLLHAHQGSETWNTQTIDTWGGFSTFGKEVGNVCYQCNILRGFMQDQCLNMEIVLASSMKAAIHLGPDFLKNSEIYKNTKF